MHAAEARQCSAQAHRSCTDEYQCPQPGQTLLSGSVVAEEKKSVRVPAAHVVEFGNNGLGHSVEARLHLREHALDLRCVPREMHGALNSLVLLSELSDR
jgi:hypothetical protein